MDNTENRLTSLKGLDVDTVVMDSTDKDLLLSQNIQNMDAVVVSIGENFQALLLTTFILKELGVKRIIARARGGVQKEILKNIGIKEILCPEDEVGGIIAEKLVNPKVLEYINLEGDYEIVEVAVPKRYEGSTIIETEIRDKYNLNIITILREKEKKGKSESIGVPEMNTKLEREDILLLFGKAKDIERFTKINN